MPSTRSRGWGPNGGYTQSVCSVDHAVVANEAWENFCKNPGPIVVGAVQGASCFGPAYEMALIMDTDLRKRKIRDKVPMTFVSPEPYVGHLGLGGVGDSKGMLESELRSKHIKWICNAKVAKVEDGTMHVVEVDEAANEKAHHELPFKYSMMLPAFKGINAILGIEGLVNPRGFVVVDKHQRNPKYPNIFGVGVIVAIPPVETCPLPVGAPKTGYMIESMVTAAAHNIRPPRSTNEEPDKRSDLERHLPRRFRRSRHSFRRPAPDSTAKCQLVRIGPLGASGQDRVREVLHAQDQEGHVRADLREVHLEGARRRQAQGPGIQRADGPRLTDQTRFGFCLDR